MRRHSRSVAASLCTVPVRQPARGGVDFASLEGYEMNDETQTPGAGPQGTGQESSMGGASEWSTVPSAQPPAPPAQPPSPPAQSLEPLPTPPPAAVPPQQPAGGISAGVWNRARDSAADAAGWVRKRSGWRVYAASAAGTTSGIRRWAWAAVSAAAAAALRGSGAEQ